MKRLRNDAREAISSQFANHLIYRLIKQTETYWFDQTPTFRLSAEQVFVEVVAVLDEIKKQLEITELPDAYNKKRIAVLQDNYDVQEEECIAVVTIIMTVVVCILGCSRYDGYRYELAGNIARQCAAFSKGYSKRLRGVMKAFEDAADDVQQWVDDEYMIGDERYLSTQIGSLLAQCQMTEKEGENARKLEEFAAYFTYRFRTHQRQQFEHVMGLLSEKGLGGKDYARYAYILYNSEELVPERRPETFKDWYMKCCELIGWTYVKSYDKDKVRDAYENKKAKRLAVYLTRREE